MALIKLTPDELRQSATKYTAGAQSVMDVLTSLTNEQSVISDNWDGNAFDAFEQQFNELAPKIRQFSELLKDINQHLNHVTTTLEETDNTLAGR